MSNHSLSGKHIVRIEDLTTSEIEEVMRVARDMRSLVQKKGTSDMLKGNIMSTLFYEPSSRTYGSFVAAMQRLGGGVIPLQDMSHSSVVKGETFEDTVETFSKLSDVIVLRHPEEGSAQRASKVSEVPIINAGDGAGEHPTQAMLDMFTISDHFQDISKLTITLVGDLLYGRTVHSLIQLLARYKPREIVLVSPKELRMPPAILKKTEKGGTVIRETNDMKDALSDSDVVYMTRIQKERFSDPVAYERLKNTFQVTEDITKQLKKTSVLMHPLPRVNEISPEVDADPRALYMREQVSNGLYTRMALLSLMLAR